MERASTVTVLGIVVVIVVGFAPLAGIAGSAAAGPVADPVCEDRTPHPPIRIAEDHGPEGFTWTNPVTGADEHRPGSGVVQGDGSADDPYVISGWCIQATAPGTITGDVFYTQAGIVLNGTGAHVVVEDTRVVGPPAFGGAGILVYGAANVTLTDNTVVMADAGIGIDVESSDGIELTWNDVSGGLMGIWLLHADDARLVDNEAEGIRLERSDDGRLTRNLVTDLGVDLIFAPRVAVVDNTVTDADGDGIEVRYGNRPDLIGNTVTGAGISDDGTPTGHGIVLERTGDAELTGNVIAGSGFHGVTVGANDLTLVDNEIRDNGGRGIALFGPQRSEVVDNVATGNGQSGIRVVDGDDVTVADNVASDNGWNGIWAGQSSDVEVANNTADGNIFDGVHVWRSTGVDVIDNTVRNNSRDGVVVRDGSTATVEANQVTGNVDDAVALIDLTAGHGVGVHQNNLDGNGGEGLFADDVAGTVDATGNWWGDDTGPSGDVLDACTGTPADGDGAAIDTVGADVCFNPWRTSPNPDAGAS